jgi:hypothetical protein
VPIKQIKANKTAASLIVTAPANKNQSMIKSDHHVTHDDEHANGKYQNGSKK